MLGLLILVVATAITFFVLRKRMHLSLPATLAMLAVLTLMLLTAGVAHAGGGCSSCYNQAVVQQVVTPYYQNVVTPIVLPTTQYLVQPQRVVVQKQVVPVQKQAVVVQRQVQYAQPVVQQVNTGRTKVVQRRSVSRIRGGSAAVVVGY